jgi:hypothetical protein
MVIEEFAALKVGDRIEMPQNGSKGTVVEVSSRGLRLHWDGTGEGHTMAYDVQTSMWKHWKKLEGSAS